LQGRVKVWLVLLILKDLVKSNKGRGRSGGINFMVNSIVSLMIPIQFAPGADIDFLPRILELRLTESD
jgi:hypothetical protein